MLSHRPAFIKRSAKSPRTTPPSHQHPHATPLVALKSFFTSSGTNKIPSKWKLEFLHYLKDIPAYYVPLLRRALGSPTNVPSTAHIWPELGLVEGGEGLTSAGEEEERVAQAYSTAIRAAVQAQQLRLTTDLHLHRLLHPDPTPPPRRFHLPISVMGDYHPHLARSAQPRNPLEEEEVTQRRARQLFGNPYRVDPKVPVSIDEEDEAARMDEEEQEIAQQQHQQQLTPPPSEVDGAQLALSVASSTSGGTGGLWKRKPRRRLVFPLTPFQWDRVPRLAASVGEPLLFVPCATPTPPPDGQRARTAGEVEGAEEAGGEVHLTYANIKRARYPDMRAHTQRLLERMRVEHAQQQQQAAASASLSSSSSTVSLGEDGLGAEEETAAFVRELEAESRAEPRGEVSPIFRPALPALPEEEEEEAEEADRAGELELEMEEEVELEGISPPRADQVPHAPASADPRASARRAPAPLAIQPSPSSPLEGDASPLLLQQQQEAAMLDLRLSIKRLIQRAGQRKSLSVILPLSPPFPFPS